MAATAPFCNVTVFAPAPGPRSPHGFRLLSPNATLADVIAAINNNFSPQVQDAEFNRRLERDIKGGFAKTPQVQFKPSSKGQVPKAIDDKLSKMLFLEKSIVRKKIKVTNPDDEEQYIIDNRVVSLVMRDRTGATWVFSDKKSGDTTTGGFNPETTNSGG